MKKIIIIMLAILLVNNVLSFSKNVNKEEEITKVAEIKTNNIYELNSDYTSYDSIYLDNHNTSSTSNSVLIDDLVVTITSGGVYIVSGTLNNGQIIVDSPDESVHLVLDNINIYNDNKPGIFINTSKKFAKITLAENSVNIVTVEKNEMEAAIYLKQDLIFNGTGTLIVNSTNNDGIKSSDSIYFVEGIYNVTSDKDAITGKDAVIIENGIFNIQTYLGASQENKLPNTNEDTVKISRKGIKSDGEIIVYNGTFYLDTYDDSINSDTYIEINGGDFTINSGDDGIKSNYELIINDGNIKIDLSYEAIESKVIYFNGGQVNAVSLDDVVNASDPMVSNSRGDTPQSEESKKTIDYDNDPMIYFNGTNIVAIGGGDTIDANGSIIVNGGNIMLYGVNNGGEITIDFDKVCIVNGGNLLALGGNRDISLLSTQHVITTSLSDSIDVDEELVITDEYGNILFATTAIKSVDVITFSSADIKEGETYYINYGDNSNTIVASSESITNNNTTIKFKGVKRNEGEIKK